MRLDGRDRRLLEIVQEGFPVSRDPYAELGRLCGLEAGECLRRLASLRRRGVVRRLGVLLDSRRLGMAVTLVGADVAPRRVGRVAGRLDGLDEVTHSYLRGGRPNLWFTLVAGSRRRIGEILAGLAAEPGVLSLFEAPATRVYKLAVRFGGSGEPGELASGPGPDPGPVPGRHPGEARLGPPAPAARLSPAERDVLAGLARGVPGGRRPWAAVARRLGRTEAEVIEAVRGMLARRLVRRVAAVVDGHRLGFGANALVAWRVPLRNLDRAGAAAARRAVVSHVCARRAASGWPYNLYTMVHARTRSGLLEAVGALRADCGTEECRVLPTLREFTKRPPRFARG